MTNHESPASLPLETLSEENDDFAENQACVLLGDLKDSGSKTRQSLLDVWKKPVMGRLEAIVSDIKLYDYSFCSLKTPQWIVDECFALSATVSSSIFLGKYRSPVFRVSYETVETVLCPTNTGNHWILFILKPFTKKILVYDSLPANLHTYKVFLRNWRDFLQALKHPDYELWELVVDSNVKQQDNYNCGVFCMLVMINSY
ncbi:uncharacterized protein LOC144768458 [Lissotriton helveticus]